MSANQKAWITVGVGCAIIIGWITLLGLRMAGYLQTTDSSLLSSFTALQGLAYASIAAITSIVTGAASVAGKVIKGTHMKSSRVAARFGAAYRAAKQG